MGYYLTIDQGNSSAKVVVWHNDEPIGEHYFESLSAAHIEPLIDKHGIDAAIYCSVAAVGTDIMDSLSQKCQLAIELTHLTPMPLTIGYATPHSLGRDRIATAVGAQCRFPGTTVLVVDMGTAVTLPQASTCASKQCTTLPHDCLLLTQTAICRNGGMTQQQQCAQEPLTE